MKLPVPAFLENIGRKEKQNYFLALLLRDEKAVAIVLQEVNGQIKLIGQAEEAITQQVEDIPYEELLAILDKTISQAEETLPPQIQTEKTIFGVKETWVEDKKIKKEYLAKLKKVCDALSLSPIGFMVVSEAIANLLQQVEGAPLSAMLAEVGEKHVTLSLFRAGKLIESYHKTIDSALPKVVDTLLFHFTANVLPSRIIIFNGGNESLGQEFIAHQWSHGLPFLHVPQIAVLPTEFDGKAMIVGVAQQLGFSVADSLGDTKVHDLGTSEKTSGKTNAEDAADEDSSTSPVEENETLPVTTSAVSAEKFGFVVGEDIAKIKPPLESSTPDEMDATTPTESETHHQRTTFGKEHDNLRLPIDQPKKMHHDSLANDEEERPSKSGLLSSLPFGSFTSSLKNTFSSLPLPSLALPAGIKGGKLMLIVPALLILLGSVVYLYFFQLQATIILTVQPQIVRENEAITLASGKDNNFADGTLAAKTIEVAVLGESKAQATGKKEVGEKAKGTVTLFNSSESKRNLPKGTTISASNDRKFITEGDVSVASASGDIFSGIKSGTTKVNVVAQEIGQEYNMPSNTTFSVEGSTTLAGKNESAFSGGTKKDITVVSQKDITGLTEKLPKSLEDQAKKELAAKVGGGEAVLGVFTDISIDEETTTADAGDEAKEVSLKATVTFKTLSYKESDIADLAKETLISTNANGLTLSQKSLKTQLKDFDVESEDEVKSSLEMEAGLLPKIEQEKIAADIKGKSFSEAEDYLSRLSQVRDATITLSPNLPFLPKLLPRNATKIKVEVVSNG